MMIILYHKCRIFQRFLDIIKFFDTKKQKNIDKKIKL